MWMGLGPQNFTSAASLVGSAGRLVRRAVELRCREIPKPRSAPLWVQAVETALYSATVQYSHDHLYSKHAWAMILVAGVRYLGVLNTTLYPLLTEVTLGVWHGSARILGYSVMKRSSSTCIAFDTWAQDLNINMSLLDSSPHSLRACCSPISQS